MPAMFMWILAAAVGGVATGTWLNKKAVEDEENPLEPKMWGQDARNVVMGVGTVLAFLVGGPIGAAGVGAAVAAYTSKDATTRFAASLEEFAQNQKLMKPDGGTPSLPLPDAGSEVDDLEGYGWAADMAMAA